MPNEFRIGRSARYAALTTALHAGASVLIAVPLSRLSPGLALCAATLLALAWWRDLSLVAWRNARDSVLAIEVNAGCWRVRRRGAGVFGPAALESFRAARAGVLLVLRDEHGARERITLPADALSDADLRRLRVHAHAALAGAVA